VTEVVRTTPTVCYLEVPGSMMPQRAAFESDRCRVMAVASTFYGTLDEQGQWHDNGEPRDKWWDGEIDKVLAVWEAQGWDDRLALRFDWFEDKRLPKGTQAAFSARIAERVGPVLKAHGARIDFMFADNEQNVPASQLDRAFGDLRPLAKSWGNWNYAKGRTINFPFLRPPVKAPICETYTATNDDALATICQTIKLNGANCIPWGPCLNQTADNWPVVDEDTANRCTERLILYAMAQGVTRFGIHLPQIKHNDHRGEWDLARWHRVIDHTDLTIKLGDKMMGRV